MSLWWAKKDQLDKTQIHLIEQLPLRQDHLILGPPGSGKTNVLLRRAQYVRTQGMPNVMVLTFTRALTEFVKTGCYDGQGREIFPRNCVSTLEGWLQGLYREHGAEPPSQEEADLPKRKAALAAGAMSFADMNKVPKFDALFVDEAQDLMPEEVALLRTFSGALFFVGDDRQKIYTHTVGIEAVRGLTPSPSEERLPFHYRLAPQICDMADRIKPTESGTSLSSTSHYTGPKPGKVDQHGPMSRRHQVNACIELLKEQLRAYGDFIQQGDRLGIVVPKKIDRDFVLKHINSDKDLAGKAQIIRAKSGDSEDRDFDPSFDPDCPISILTEKGSKGLEFRTVHWLFCDEVQIYKSSELYYTVVTRAKTRLDMYFSKDLPDTLARAYAPAAPAEW